MNKSTEAKVGKIRTLVVENHEVTAIGTKQILEKHFPDLKPIEIALDDLNARELIKLRPEFVIMDIKLGTKEKPSDNGLLLANEFAKSYGDSKILFYSNYENLHLVKVEGDNVKSRVEKDAPLEEFLEAVRHIKNGGNISLPPDPIELLNLTPREVEYLDIFARGFTEYRDVASIMFITEVAVRAHRANVLNKLKGKDPFSWIKEGCKDDILLLNKLARLINPFPDKETTDNYRKVLNCWLGLASLLQEKKNKPETKTVSAIRHKVAQRFLEIAHDQDGKYLVVLINNFDEFEQFIEPTLNLKKGKNETKKLVAKFIMEISESFNKNRDVLPDPEELLKIIKEKLNEIQGIHRDLSEKDIDQVYEEIRKIQGEILLTAFMSGMSGKRQPNPKKLYEETIKKLEDESKDSKPGYEFTDEDKEALYNFFSVISNKIKHVRNDSEGSPQERDKFLHELDKCLKDELGKLYRLIKNDHAAKTCCDLIELINEKITPECTARK